MILSIIVFILILSLLIFVHELGHFIFSKMTGVRVEEFCIGYPPRIWKKKKGDTLYSIGIIPFGGFNKIYGETDDQHRDDSESFSNRSIRTRALISAGGVMMNILLAVVIFYSLFGFSGLQLKINLMFDYQFPFGHQEQISEDSILLSYPTTLEKASVGFLHSYNIMHYSLLGLGHVIKTSFQEGDTEPLKSSVAGPVRIFSFVGPIMAQGFIAILNLIAIISLALALFNILPIPALDGGKLLFLGIEGIRGKPISQKTEERITVFFFGLLILLMIVVTVNDIQSVFMK